MKGKITLSPKCRFPAASGSSWTLRPHVLHGRLLDLINMVVLRLCLRLPVAKLMSKLDALCFQFFPSCSKEPLRLS